MILWTVVAGAMAMAVWRFLLQKLSYNLPPGNLGWPLLGEVIPFYFRPHEFITKRREKYGNLFKTNLLGFQTVISTDAQVNNFILQNDGRLFVPQYPNSSRVLGGKSNINVARGDIHKMKRGGVMRVVGIPILKRLLLPELQNVITSSLSGWVGRNVKLTHEAEEMLFSLLASHLLSLKPGMELDKMKEDFYVYKKGFFGLSFNFPGTTFNKSLQKREELSNQIKRIIEERKRNMSSHNSSDDLLSWILKEAEENEDGEFEFATFQIVDLILSMFFSAIETIPRMLALVVRRLSENPHIIQELREEHEAIRSTKGKIKSLSWDDYKSMAFTKNVIKEAMRLGDGHINTIMLRKTIENVEMQGYTIPKGWTCVITDQFSNFDTKYYRDPLVFNPRRWQDPDMNNTPYITFGGGPRLCLGYDFSMLVISVFLHHLVTNFQWDCIPSDKLRWFDSPFMSPTDCTLLVKDLEME